MQAGRIIYRNTDISRIGTCSIKYTRRPDPPPPAAATSQIVSITLSVEIQKHTAAGAHASIIALQNLFNHREGMLELMDETGTTRSYSVQVSQDEPQNPLSGDSNIFTVQMEARVTLSESEIIRRDGSFLPNGAGATAIPLRNIRDKSEVINTEFHHPRMPYRSLTTSTISLTARVMQADPSLTRQERAVILHNAAETYRNMNSGSGILTIDDSARVLHVQELRPIIDDTCTYLDISLQGRSYTLPGSQKVEPNYTKNTSIDPATGEKITSYRGGINAETYEDAMATLEAIQISGTIYGNITKLNHTSPYSRGADSNYSEAWGGTMDFDLEYRGRDGNCIGFELRVSSEKDAKGGYRVSYSGYVSAATETLALTKARELGWNKHPLWSRANETSTTQSTLVTNNGALTCGTQFTRTEFQYDYDMVPDWIVADLTISYNRATYGDRTGTISGSINAPDKNTANLFFESCLIALMPEAASMSPAQRRSRIINDTTTESYRSALNTQQQIPVSHQFMRMDINTTLRLYNRGNTAHIKYSKTDSLSYANMLSTTDISGTIWADTPELAEATLADLIAELQLKPTELKKTIQLERVAKEGANFVQLDFSTNSQQSMAGVTGYDILEAQFTMARTGQINHAILTEIPFHQPFSQTNTGWTIGRLSISGSCKAVLKASARAWGQDKLRYILQANAHETQAPEESMTPNYEPLSDTKIATWVFQFSYSRSFASGLEGMWNNSLLSTL